MSKQNDKYLPGFEPSKKRSSKIQERRSSMKKDPLIEELRKVIKQGSTVTAAVNAIGASRNQIYNWLNYANSPNPVYRKMIEQGIIKLKSKT